MSKKESQLVTFDNKVLPSTAERFIATVDANKGKVDAEQHVITMTDGQNQVNIEIHSVTAEGRNIEKAYLQQIVSELKEQFDIDVEFKINDKYGEFESQSAFQTIRANFDSKSSESDSPTNFEEFRAKVEQALKQMRDKGVVESSDLKIEYDSQRISNADTTLQVEQYSSATDTKFIAQSELQQYDSAKTEDLGIATTYNGHDQVMKLFSAPVAERFALSNDIFIAITGGGDSASFYNMNSRFSGGKKVDYLTGFCVESNSPSCDISRQIDRAMPTLSDYKSAVLPYYTCKPLSLGAVNRVVRSDRPISEGDLILSRVYSDSHPDAEGLFPYYVSDLRHNGDIILKDVMNMISILIAQGKNFPQSHNTIKVTNWEKKIDVEINVKNPMKFVYNLDHTNCVDLNEVGKKFVAYYNIVHNIVFTKSGMQKSSLVHELTHAAMEHLFGNYGDPYPASSGDTYVEGYRAAMKESLVKVWNKLSIPNATPELMTSEEMISQLLPNHPQSLLLTLAVLRTQELSPEEGHVALSEEHLSQLEGILKQCIDCNSNRGENFSAANLFKIFDVLSRKGSDGNCFTYNQLTKLSSTDNNEIKEAVDIFIQEQGLSVDDLEVIAVYYILSSYKQQEFDREFIVLVPELRAKGVADEAIEYYFGSALKFWKENISPIAQNMVEAHKAHCEKFFYDTEAEQCKNLNAADMLAMSNSNFAHCVAEIGQPESFLVA